MDWQNGPTDLPGVQNMHSRCDEAVLKKDEAPATQCRRFIEGGKASGYSCGRCGEAFS